MVWSGVESHSSSSKSNQRRVWRSRSSSLGVGALAEDDEAIKHGTVLGVSEIAWSIVKAEVEIICGLASFQGGEELRKTFSFGSRYFDKMLSWSCLGCVWNSCDAAGWNSIDFSTHLKTPFFDSAVVSPISMHIALSFNEFAISSFAVISFWLCKHVHILILTIMIMRKKQCRFRILT